MKYPSHTNGREMRKCKKQTNKNRNQRTSSLYYTDTRLKKKNIKQTTRDSRDLPTKVFRVIKIF